MEFVAARVAIVVTIALSLSENASMTVQAMVVAATHVASATKAGGEINRVVFRVRAVLTTSTATVTVLVLKANAFVTLVSPISTVLRMSAT